MDAGLVNLDDNKILQRMRTITPDDIRMRVRLANHHVVQRGQVWERRIIDLQFIAPLAGRFRYQDAQTTIADLRPGQILCIEPGIDHQFAHDPRSGAGRITGLHGELVPVGRWLDDEYRLDPRPARVTAVVPETVQTLLRCAEVFAGYHRYRATLCDQLATAVAVDLAGSWTGAAPGIGQPPRMQAMLAYIREHAVRGCTRQDLARAFACTPEHVNWLFRRELGTTPGEVVQRERCRIAFTLLHDQGVGVAAAAAAAGYEDPFHFSRVFRKIYGLPPSRV